MAGAKVSKVAGWVSGDGVDLAFMCSEGTVLLAAPRGTYT